MHFPLLGQELDGLDPPDLPAIIPARSKPVLHAMKSLGQQAVFLFPESLASPKSMGTVIKNHGLVVLYRGLSKEVWMRNFRVTKF